MIGDWSFVSGDFRVFLWSSAMSLFDSSSLSLFSLERASGFLVNPSRRLRVRFLEVFPIKIVSKGKFHEWPGWGRLQRTDWVG
jgi:hypothetical protein